MIKEENRRRSKELLQQKRSSRQNVRLINFNVQPHRPTNNNGCDSTGNIDTFTTKNIKSFKRLGSKTVIKPYTGFIAEERKNIDEQTRPKVSNKQNLLLAGDKKKLKRIGKKAWVSAFKQTIAERDHPRQQSQSIVSLENSPDNDYHEFHQLKQPAQKPQRQKIQEEWESLLEDQIDTFSKQQESADEEIYLNKVNSEIDQLSGNCSSLQHPEDPLNSDTEPKQESQIEKTIILSEEDVEESMLPFPVAYESYSIHVNSNPNSSNEKDEAENNIKRYSRKNRESYNCSEQVQQLLLKALEKRPLVLKDGKKKTDEYLSPKRPSMTKQIHYSSECSSIISITCDQNAQKNQYSIKNNNLLTEFSTPKKRQSKTGLEILMGPIKKGLSEHYENKATIFKPKVLEISKGIFGKANDNCCSMVIPIISKIEQMRFFEPREVTKCQSMHNSAHLPGQNRSYGKTITDKGAMGSSMKRNYKQLEMNKYIQEAKQELKYSTHK